MAQPHIDTRHDASYVAGVTDTEGHRETVAATFRARRLRADLTQQQLADAAHLEQSTVSRIERGEQVPSLTTALAIAAALGCHLSDLLTTDQGATT